MAAVVEDKARFFVTGGTLPVEAGSYVDRAADTALLQALIEGKFAYFQQRNRTVLGADSRS